MSDITERLRSYKGPWLVPAEAADEIEKLRDDYAASRRYADELRTERDTARAERDAAVNLLTEIGESLDRAEDVRKTNLRTRIFMHLRGEK